MTTQWEQIDDELCRRFTATMELIGQRWNSAILLALARGATRFSEVIASVPGLSDRLLAQRLKVLEHAGLVTREVIPTTPVKIVYGLSDRGRELMRSLQPLTQWGVRWGMFDDVLEQRETA